MQETNFENKKGHFLSFEGLDGAGKSTLIAGIRDAFLAVEKDPARVIVTREPGGTPLAEKIRHLILKTEGEPPTPEAEILLYEASRAQHVAKVIAPAIKSGKIVLSDRFSESTIAFQCYGRGISQPEVEKLNRYAEQGTRPDLVILLDLTVEESRKRQKNRQAADRIELEADAFHERVRRGFLDQAKAEPSRWLVLNAGLRQEELLSTATQELRQRGWLPS